MLTADPGGSVIDPGQGIFLYPQGSIAPIETKADLNYVFDYWSGTAVDKCKVVNPLSAKTFVTVDGAYTLNAHFITAISVLFVNPKADPNGDGSLAMPFKTIQEAIDAFQVGVNEQIKVLAGTYTGPGNWDLDLKGKAIRLLSVNGPGSCIIDPTGDAVPHRGFHIHTGETAATIIEGFTILCGSEERGGALLCMGGSPTLRDCKVMGRGGQGILITGGQLNTQGTVEVLDCDLVGSGDVVLAEGSILRRRDEERPEGQEGPDQEGSRIPGERDQEPVPARSGRLGLPTRRRRCTPRRKPRRWRAPTTSTASSTRRTSMPRSTTYCIV